MATTQPTSARALETAELLSDKKRYPAFELAVVAGLFMLLYFPTWKGLFADWRANPIYSHGYLILLLSAYVFWQRRSSLTSCSKSPSWAGFLILMLGLALLTVSIAAEEEIAERVSLPLTLFGLLYFLGGQNVARLAWFPVAYLYIAIPPPFLIFKAATLHLRLLGAATAQIISGWFGVPVYRESYLLHLPTITLEVSDGCSGIFSIVGLVALGTLYARQHPSPLRFVLVFSLIPIAVLANVIRLIIMVLVCHYSGPWIVGSTLHEVSGIPMFLLGMGMVIGLAAILERILPSRLRPERN